MKEINDIIKAFEEANLKKKQTALATVVHVEGSSYRRPGARMLISDDGQLTGAISGGCLEGDALRKAMLAITQGQNKLVTYDTTDEDDLKFGVQLGCNGIVHILFEPIHQHNPENAIQLLQQLIAVREDAVLVTLFSLKHSEQPGTSLLYRPGATTSSIQHGHLKELVLTDAKAAFENDSSTLQDYELDGKHINGFVECVKPPVAVVIAGAGNDVKPLVGMASLLGWQTTVVDGRGTHATAARFPKLQRVLVAKPHEVLKSIVLDSQMIFLLMTHNYNYDLALLKELLQTECRYIGILGPKKKMERMFDDLGNEGITVTEEQRSRIYSPVGLDIGAETSEEIAVAVIAEIKAVLSGRSGTSLKNKAASIHSRISIPAT